MTCETLAALMALTCSCRGLEPGRRLHTTSWRLMIGWFPESATPPTPVSYLWLSFLYNLSGSLYHQKSLYKNHGHNLQFSLMKLFSLLYFVFCTLITRKDTNSIHHHHHHHHHHGEDGSRPQRPLYPRNKNNITHYLYTNY